MNHTRNLLMVLYLAITSFSVCFSLGLSSAALASEHRITFQHKHTSFKHLKSYLNALKSYVFSEAYDQVVRLNLRIEELKDDIVVKNNTQFGKKRKKRRRAIRKERSLIIEELQLLKAHTLENIQYLDDYILSEEEQYKYILRNSRKRDINASPRFRALGSFVQKIRNHIYDFKEEITSALDHKIRKVRRLK
ncbi:MAG: hypothetical protein OXC44_00810 [Proteobacteria bacterium]|nr:hypothetical protein [Pseudomonadota bacterium]